MQEPPQRLANDLGGRRPIGSGPLEQRPQQLRVKPDGLDTRRCGTERWAAALGAPRDHRVDVGITRRGEGGLGTPRYPFVVDVAVAVRPGHAGSSGLAAGEQRWALGDRVAVPISGELHEGAIVREQAGDTAPAVKQAGH